MRPSSSSSTLSSSLQEKKFESQSLYRPIVFQYTCYGALFVNESRTEQFKTPTCYGIESHLQKVQELPYMKEEEALQAFLWHTSKGAKGSLPPSERSRVRKSVDTPQQRTTKEEDEELPIFSNTANLKSQRQHKPQNIPKQFFYGSTDVSLLMLQSTKQAQVVAVAAECRLGLTIQYESEDNVGTGGRKDNERNESRSHRHFTNNKEETTNTGIFSKWMGTSQNNNTHRYNGKEEEGNSAEYYLTQTLYMAKKIGESMQNNSKIIWGELSDDFLPRVARAGEKVVGNFGKTLERTGKVVVEVYKMWTRHDDDDDDDDDN